MWGQTNLWLVLALVLAVAVGCSSGTGSESGTTDPTVSNSGASLNKGDYPVFPDPDSGADPAIPAEQGGKGFTGEGWETNLDFDLIGDPRAVKGGVFRETATDFPSTLRPEGPNTTTFNWMVRDMVYETLLEMHPTTLEYIPGLASHWQISPDRSTYRFRINPNARWADGQPVVADDVVASWELWMDPGMQDPMLPVVFSKFEKPVAESKYIVRVKTNTPNWRNFLYFSASMYILPAHILKDIDAASFIRDYNYKMIPGSSAYTVSEADVDKGNTIKIRRRSDYWAENHRRNIGRHNFEEVQVVVVRDRNLEFEMFKKGDLDYYIVNRAQMWEEELDFDEVKRGLVQKRRIWNHRPQGMVGMAMNTRREPFNDIRVRKALRYLYNREQIIDKLMYGAYTPMDSSYPGSVWENPNNEKVTYDATKALQLLGEAGWKERDNQGRLTRNGAPLVIELLYGDQTSERHLTVYQEDLRKVGITLNLRLVTWETMIKLVDEQQFGLVALGYGGITFPNPETSLLSSLADQKNNNNITGFKNARVDELIAKYDTAYDVSERVEIIREIDKLFTDEHHWIFDWYAPYRRIVFWNKFGAPQGHFTRTGDTRDIVHYWWVEPEKVTMLDAARADSSVNLQVGETEDKYWLEFAKTEEQAQVASKPGSE